MDDEIDELLVSVRADTRGFADDMAAMRSRFDGTLVDGLARAGDVLERGLLTAIRRGNLGFEDLGQVATRALDRIAEHALGLGLDALFSPGGGSAPGGSGLLAGLIGAILGLPGRATGGLVAPDRPFLVGERGPELFVPASAGRIEPTASLTGARGDVRVAISLAAPRGTEAPLAMRRSARQVASAVRRALST